MTMGSIDDRTPPTNIWHTGRTGTSTFLRHSAALRDCMCVQEAAAQGGTWETLGVPPAHSARSTYPHWVHLPQVEKPCSTRSVSVYWAFQDSLGCCQNRKRGENLTMGTLVPETLLTGRYSFTSEESPLIFRFA